MTESESKTAAQEEAAQHCNQNKGFDDGDERPTHIIDYRKIKPPDARRAPVDAEVKKIELRPTERCRQQRKSEFRQPETWREPSPAHLSVEQKLTSRCLNDEVG